jgi:hypothetical protein
MVSMISEQGSVYCWTLAPALIFPVIAGFRLHLHLKSLDASACFGPGGSSGFEAYPLPSSRLDSSLLCASIFLGCLVGTLCA